MATIEITNGELRVHVHGIDKILSLKSTLVVPLTHVTGAHANPPEADYDHGQVRIIGAHWPGRVAAGWFYLKDQGVAFLDVHDKTKAISVDIDHEQYKKIVVQVDDETPEQAVARIEQARVG